MFRSTPQRPLPSLQDWIRDRRRNAFGAWTADLDSVTFTDADVRALARAIDPATSLATAGRVVAPIAVTGALAFPSHALAQLSVGPPPAQPTLTVTNDPPPVQGASPQTAGNGLAVQPAAHVQPQPAAPVTAVQPAAPTPEAVQQPVGGQAAAAPAPAPQPEPVQVQAPPPTPAVTPDPGRVEPAILPSGAEPAPGAIAPPAGAPAPELHAPPAPAPDAPAPPANDGPLVAQGAPDGEPDLTGPDAVPVEQDVLPSEVRPSLATAPLGVAPAPAAGQTLVVKPVASAAQAPLHDATPGRIVHSDGTFTDLHPTVTGPSLDRPVPGSGRTAKPRGPSQGTAKAASHCIEGYFYAGPGGGLEICSGPAGITGSVKAGGGIGGGLNYRYNPDSPADQISIAAQTGARFGAVGGEISGSVDADGTVSAGGSVSAGPGTGGIELRDGQARPTGSVDLSYEYAARRTLKTGVESGASAEIVIPSGALNGPLNDLRDMLGTFKRLPGETERGLKRKFGPRSGR